MESTDIEEYARVLADIERRNSERLFYRLFPAADQEQPDGSVTRDLRWIQYHCVR